MTGASKLDKVFFSPAPDSPRLSPASAMEIRSFIGFSAECGFETVVARKSVHSGRRYFSEYQRARRRATVFLAAYPRFCSPHVGMARMFLDLGQTAILSFLKNRGSRTRSILYVVDLPLEQAAAQKIKIPATAHTLESKVFDSFDIICVYNEKMKNTIVRKHGISENRFVKFEIIDYGVRFNPPINKAFDQKSVTIVHTGNLSKSYAGEWMNNLPQMDNIHYEILGTNGEWLSRIGRTDVAYKGFIPSFEELAGYLSESAQFGLVRASDGLKDYYEYTSTSKLSGYLAAGLPVIVTSDYVYLTNLVRKYGCGIVLDSLDEIPNAIENMSQKEYDEIRTRSLALGGKIRRGYFFKHAIQTATALRRT